MTQQSANGTGVLTINLADEGRLLTMKTILAYESTVRGRTIGQTSSELVQEAADVSSYSEEVQSRLAEIAEQSERRAVAKSLEMTE